MSSQPGDTLGQVRKTMTGSLKLPAEWVFLLKGAPVGKKAEGKRFARDLGETITIRDKSARPAKPTEVPASPSRAGGDVPVALESGGTVGQIRVDKSATLQVARRMIQAQHGGSLPAEYVFVRNSAPVGMKQERKVTVADCMPVLMLRDKRSRRSSAPPTPARASPPSRPPPVAAESEAVPLVRTQPRFERRGDSTTRRVLQGAFSADAPKADKAVSALLGAVFQGVVAPPSPQRGLEAAAPTLAGSG